MTGVGLQFLEGAYAPEALAVLRESLLRHESLMTREGVHHPVGNMEK
jgi:hypothetical protein